MNKKIAVLAASALMAFSAVAFAATYPITNPTYIPNAAQTAGVLSAPGDYEINANGLATVTFNVSGTCTGLVAAPQVTNDGTNWTSVRAVPAAGGPSVASVASTGMWSVNASGMTAARLHVTALSASCTMKAVGNAGAGIVSINALDPCQDPMATKSSVAVNQGASATAAIVAAVTGKKTYVCGLLLTAAGTDPTVTVVTGTQTTTPCDTGASNLSGAMTPSATKGVLALATTGSIASTAASGQLCLTTAATTSIQGVVTYVQQ